MAKKTQLIDKKPKIKKQSSKKPTSRLKKVPSESLLSESSDQNKQRSHYHWTATESLHYFFCQVINYHYLPKQKKQKNEALKYVEKFIKTKTSTQYISHNQKELEHSNSYKDLIRYYYGIFYNLRVLKVQHMVKEIDLFLKSIDFTYQQKEKMMRQALLNMKEIQLIAEANFEKYGEISSLLFTNPQSIQLQKEATYQPFPHQQVSQIIDKLKQSSKDQISNEKDRMQFEIDSKSQISQVYIKYSCSQLPQLQNLPQLPQLPLESLQEIELWNSEGLSIQSYRQHHRDFFGQYQSSEIQLQKSDKVNPFQRLSFL